MLARNETLFHIPCWWDGEESRYVNRSSGEEIRDWERRDRRITTCISLIGTIRFQRPDLLQQYSRVTECIPFNFPLDFFECMISPLSYYSPLPPLPPLPSLYFVVFFLFFRFSCLIFITDYSIPDVGDLMLASLPLSSQFVKTISVDTPWYEKDEKTRKITKNINKQEKL